MRHARLVLTAVVGVAAGCPLGVDNTYFAPCASDADCGALTCEPVRSVCVTRGPDAGPEPGADAGPDAGPKADAGPDAEPDAGPDDAGPREPVVFTFADDAAFATGTLEDLDVGGGLRLTSNQDGFWLSPILTVPVAMTPSSLELVAGLPWGVSFPIDPFLEPGSGGVNPDKLALALGFDGPAGPVDALTPLEDQSASPAGVTLVQIGPSSGATREPDGPIGNALFLSGQEYLDVDTSIDGDFLFGGGGFTFAAWVRSGDCALSEDNVIALGGQHPHVWLGANCDDGSGDAVFVVEDDVGAHIKLVRHPVSITDDQWHHLVGVQRDDNGPKSAELWLDGELVASASDAWGTFDLGFNDGLFLGNFPLGAPPDFAYQSRVAVDEVAVFDRALADQEIVRLFQRGAGTLRATLIPCESATSCTGGAFGPGGAGSFFIPEPGAVPFEGAAAGTAFRIRVDFVDRFGAQPDLDAVTLTLR